MPHLQFDLNFEPTPEQKLRFGRAVAEHFGRVMDTGTDHVAVSLRCLGRDGLVFGRAERPEQGIAFVNADIRNGRTAAQKRQLALAFIDELHRSFGVPKRSVYVIYTEHDGEHFQLEEKVLPSWTPGEDPLAPP